MDGKEEINIPVRLASRLTNQSKSRLAAPCGRFLAEWGCGRVVIGEGDREGEKRKLTYQFDWRRDGPTNRNRGRQEPRGRFRTNRESGRVAIGEEDRERGKNGNQRTCLISVAIG